jgi:hypothetical protein
MFYDYVVHRSRRPVDANQHPLRPATIVVVVVVVAAVVVSEHKSMVTSSCTRSTLPE